MSVLDLRPPPTASARTPGRKADRRAGVLATGWMVFLFILLSGALQRPMGGGDLQGSMTTMIVQSENRGIQLLGAATICLTGFMILARFPRIALPRASGWAITLNMLALASVIWSPLPELTLKRAAGLSGATLIGVHLYSAYRWQDLVRGLVWAMSGLVLATVLMALVAPGYAFHQPGEFYGEHAGLLKGSYVHKNSLARVLSCALVVIFFLGPDVFAKRRIAGLLSLVALILILMTGSAKTLVTLPAAFAASWLLFRGRTITGRVLILAALGYVTVLVVASGIDDWMRSAILGSLGRDPTLSGRTLIWKSAIDYTVRQGQWFWGGGYEAAWQAGIGDYVQSRTTFNPGHPHNGYIALFNQVGTLGLAIATLHLARCFWRILRQADPATIRLSRFSMTWLILFLANNTAGSYFILPMDLYWVMILLTPAFGHWAGRDGEPSRPGFTARETRCGRAAGW